MSHNTQGQIEQFENSLQAPLKLKGVATETFSLRERMDKYKVPGVSMALIEKGKIAWTKSWGVKDVDSGEPVTDDTLFQAASMSKPVAALAAMRMVDAGDLHLDVPINNSLSRWQVPSNDLTEQQAVTLRHLLSHTAGTTVHGFLGYTQGEAHPNGVDVLNGSGTANSEAVKVYTLPGTNWRYSGGGYTAFQVAMEDVSDSRFSSLLHQLVLMPVGMHDSAFQQPLPEALWHKAASGHHGNGSILPGKHHHYPEIAAAGLWSTPGDLAKFLLATKDIALGEDNALLSPQNGRDFLHVQARGAGGPWALGYGLHEKDGDIVGFHHGGDNEGFHGDMHGFLNGSGAVIMTNGDQGPLLIREILAAAAEQYQWPARQVKEKAWLPLSAEEQASILGSYSITLDGKTHKIVLEPLNEAVVGPAILLCAEDEADTSYYLEKRQDNRLHFFATNGATLQISYDDKGQPVLNALGVALTKEPRRL